MGPSKKLYDDILMSFPSGEDMVRSISKVIRKEPLIEKIIYPKNINYGFLYNWYAVNDSRNIAPIGWHVPTQEDWITLDVFIGGNPGDKLKETGSIRWFPDVNNSTNNYLFDGRPGGFRNNVNFYDVNSKEYIWSSTEASSQNGYSVQIFSSNLDFGQIFKTDGLSIRCVRDSGSTLTEATDIDGNVYESTNIGSQTWLRRDLITTRYRNGDSIPNVTNNTAWGSLSSGAYCAYNNDISMAFQ